MGRMVSKIKVATLLCFSQSIVPKAALQHSGTMGCGIAKHNVAVVPTIALLQSRAQTEGTLLTQPNGFGPAALQDKSHIDSPTHSTLPEATLESTNFLGVPEWALTDDLKLPRFPGVHPLRGERMRPVNVAEEEELQVWNKLSEEVRRSLSQPKPAANIGFQGWVGKQQSPLLEDDDFKVRAAIYTLFTDAEAKELMSLAGTEAGKHIPSKEQLEKDYVGRFNTLRQSVKDRWLAGALWKRLSENPGGLADMQYWDKVVGANSELRLVRTQPPRHEGEKAGQHLKHVDTREDNKDFVSDTQPEQATRISVITVQCYLNPEEHEGGEFVVWPARLNLAAAGNEKDTTLFEQQPETNDELVSVKIPMKNGQCVVFHQESDQLYHGGAPVSGNKDKVALRFVLDMEKKGCCAGLVDMLRRTSIWHGFHK